MPDQDPLGWLGAEIEGRVVVDAIVGEGGFGVVYRGRHLGFEETVAIKCLKVPLALTESDRQAFLKSFRAEARTLHRLSRADASIVQALDVGAATSPAGIWTPYIVMEWLSGEPLGRFLRQRPERTLTEWLHEAGRLFLTALEGMAVAHAHGIAHLDLKPANLFVVGEGDEQRLKVLDFGVARVFRSQSTRALSQGDRPLTPHYAAPEQFDKVHGAIGPRTDVFALGLVWYEMVTGLAALDGDSPLQLYIAASNERRPTFQKAGFDVGRAMEEVLQGALAVSVAERFADARTLAEALSAALGEAGGTTRQIVGVARTGTARHAESTARSGQNRVCTVMFVEIAWSATNAPSDEEQLASVLAAASELVRKRGARLGGELEALAAGAAIGVFGLHEDDGFAAQRAIRAALEIKEGIAELAATTPYQLGVRIGIQTGRIFIAGQALATDLVGTPVRVALRLQQAADTGEILIGQDCCRHIAGLFATEQIELPTNKLGTEGRDLELGPAHRVLGTLSGPADLDQLAGRDFHGVTTTFVGRASELASVEERAASVAHDGSARVLVVEGERGLGKTRFLLEASERLAAAGFDVMASAASPLRARVGYGTIASMLRGYFHLNDDDAREEAAMKLRRRMPRASRYARRPRARAAPLSDAERITVLLRVLGLSPHEGDDAITEAESEGMKNRVAAAVASVLSSSGRPVALLVDDLQWADRASIELFVDLARRLIDQPLLIVVAHQTGFDVRFSSETADRIVLEKMPAQSLRTMMLERLCRVERVPEDLLADMVQRAAGNPRVLVALLHLMVDAGAVEGVGQRVWSVHQSRAASLRLPTTVQEIVQARLDRLEPAQHQLVCEAAVVGLSFWDGCLASLSTAAPRSAGSVASALAELAQRRLMRAVAHSRFPGQREFSFVERTTQEVAYDTLSSSVRMPLHGRVAAWLCERTTSANEASLIAHHFERAGELSHALDWYRSGGGHAARLGHSEDAQFCFERACTIDRRLHEEDAAIEEAAELGWADRISLRLELADVVRRMGRLEAALAVCEEARAIADAAPPDATEEDRAAWQARLLYRRAQVRHLLGETDEPLRELGEALPLAEAAGLRDERGMMLALVAALERRRGNFPQSERACRQGIRVCRAPGRRSGAYREAVSRLLQTLGTLSYAKGRYKRAERLYRQSGSVLFEEREPHLAARAANNVAAVRFAVGDTRAARDAFERALALAERSGDLRMTVVALSNLGEAHQELGEWEASGPLIDEALELGQRVGATSELADIWRNAMQQRLQDGDTEDAVHAACQALQHSADGPGRTYRQSILAQLERALPELRKGRDLKPLRDALEHEAGFEHASLARSLIAALGAENVVDG